MSNIRLDWAAGEGTLRLRKSWWADGPGGSCSSEHRAALWWSLTSTGFLFTPIAYLAWNKPLLSATHPLRHLKRGKGIMHAVLSGDEITVMDGYSSIGSVGCVSCKAGQTAPLGPSHRSLHQP